MPNINRKGKKDCQNKERAGTRALKQPNVYLPQLRLKKPTKTEEKWTKTKKNEKNAGRRRLSAMSVSLHYFSSSFWKVSSLCVWSPNTSTRCLRWSSILHRVRWKWKGKKNIQPSEQPTSEGCYKQNLRLSFDIKRNQTWSSEMLSCASMYSEVSQLKVIIASHVIETSDFA